ncbi:hypothetical protein BJ322DRAFT_207374 [Thelephora terrestris]|uniref:Uncharacterized protein n=1 Tax=Thelephora terrestris TaxID=56493 RepID=A0A9P6H9K7_9AGAM|nr:hypothetical protein BJ322DRAFT_207374 [Thelephora terrestris]
MVSAFVGSSGSIVCQNTQVSSRHASRRPGHSNGFRKHWPSHPYSSIDPDATFDFNWLRRFIRNPTIHGLYTDLRFFVGRVARTAGPLGKFSTTRIGGDPRPRSASVGPEAAIIVEKPRVVGSQLTLCHLCTLVSFSIDQSPSIHCEHCPRAASTCCVRRNFFNEAGFYYDSLN